MIAHVLHGDNENALAVLGLQTVLWTEIAVYALRVKPLVCHCVCGRGPVLVVRVQEAMFLPFSLVYIPLHGEPSHVHLLFAFLSNIVGW